MDGVSFHRYDATVEQNIAMYYTHSPNKHQTNHPLITLNIEALNRKKNNNIYLYIFIYKNSLIMQMTLYTLFTFCHTSIKSTWMKMIENNLCQYEALNVKTALEIKQDDFSYKLRSMTVLSQL